MNRAQRRQEHKVIKKMSDREFWKTMDEVHTRAYELAVKHYGEAMAIVLQPKQAAAVEAKAKEICELWDGLRQTGIKVEDTEGGGASMTEQTVIDKLQDYKRIVGRIKVLERHPVGMGYTVNAIAREVKTV